MDGKALGILFLLAARAGHVKKDLQLRTLKAAVGVTCHLEAPRQITQSCGSAFTSGPWLTGAAFPSFLSFLSVTYFRSGFCSCEEPLPLTILLCSSGLSSPTEDLIGTVCIRIISGAC